MYDVCALGELLIDFTPVGTSDQNNVIYEQNPGGAPANVVAALSKLGKKTAFIGKVGNDAFGHFLGNVLGERGVDGQGLVYSDEFPTTLAFVHLQEDGERSFSFYRKHSADQNLSKDEVRFDLIAESRVFHFGSVSMTDEPSATATLEAARFARENGVLVSFDPNLREPLWDDLARARDQIRAGLGFTDILKVSEEELYFITESEDLERGSHMLHEKYAIPFIFVTLGEKGCFVRRRHETATVPGFSVPVVDTTGAGDGFLGGILSRILNFDDELARLSKDDIVKMTRFACGVGALTTTRRGGMTALPGSLEVKRFLAERK
ncbi:MAG: carbohydrate kinase [Bacillaceae bacterium]|nr:carbohydrate kinase [Bacillaceae bacterium]